MKILLTLALVLFCSVAWGDTYEKVDDYTIRVTGEKPAPVVVSVTYDYKFLLEQKKAIQAQKDRDNAQRDLELKQVDTLLTEALKLGLKEKPRDLELPEETKPIE